MYTMQSGRRWCLERRPNDCEEDQSKERALLAGRLLMQRDVFHLRASAQTSSPGILGRQHRWVRLMLTRHMYVQTLALKEHWFYLSNSRLITISKMTQRRGHGRPVSVPFTNLKTT